MKKEEPKNNRGVLIVFYILVFGFLIFLGFSYYIDLHEVYYYDKEIEIDSSSSYQIDLLPKYSDRFEYDNYIFESENPSVAVVDKYGLVKAVGKGNTNINVRFKHGFEKKSMSVSVSDIVVKKLKVKNISVDKNNTIEVKSIINDKDNINVSLKYESSDTSVFTVDTFGNLTGVEEGEAKLTVRTLNGKVATSKVKVKASKDDIQQIKIKEESVELSKGESRKLHLVTVPSNATSKGVKWTSSDINVVTVDKNGKITAHKNGSAVIKVKTKNGLVANTLVNVNEEEILVLNTYSKYLKVGESFKLEANMNVSWKSSDKKIASVNSSGKITAKKPGTVIITASTSNQKNECKVYIYNKNEKDSNIKETPTLIINKSKINLNEGESVKLEAIVTPLNLKDKSIIWMSSNSKIAKVTQNGNVNGLKSGTAKITAYLKNDKSIKYDVVVNVKSKNVNAKSIILDKSSLKLIKGESDLLVASLVPNNVSNKALKWTSSNTSVATVDKNGKVTASSVGNAIISVETINGKKATCNVSVIDASVRVSSISILSDVTSLKSGSSVNLGVGFTPADASNKNVKWVSSDSSIAVVDDSGKITAKKPGAVKMTAISNDGNKKAVTTVIVRSVQSAKQKTSYKYLGKIKIEGNLIHQVSEDRVSSEQISSNKISNSTCYAKQGFATIKTAEGEYYLYGLGCGSRNGSIFGGSRLSFYNTSNQIEKHLFIDSNILGHVNDLTYNTKTGDIYIAGVGNYYSSNCSARVINLADLNRLKSGTKIDNKVKKVRFTDSNGNQKNVSAIAYDKRYDYMYGVDGNTMYVFNSNNKLVNTFTKYKDSNDKNNYIGQGIAAYNGYIIVVRQNDNKDENNNYYVWDNPNYDSLLDTPNMIDIYKNDGTYVGTYIFDASSVLSKVFEIESLAYNEKTGKFAFSLAGRVYEDDIPEVRKCPAFKSNGWQEKDNKWYYVENGVTLSDWQEITYEGKKRWFYFDQSNCAMERGWHEYAGIWYNQGRDGAMLTGWQKIEYNSKDEWFYFKNSGAMVTGLQTINGNVFYFNDKGVMQHDKCMTINGKYYCFDSNGYAK